MAIEALRQSPGGFDAVLMDVQMPGTDGLMATRMIRQELGLQALPIIGMTANLYEQDRQACFEAGMNQHVGKPFNVADLVQALNGSLATGPVASPGLVQGVR
jgi:CheY-like chemotaxis protein